jgi:hypothetical protein
MEGFLLQNREICAEAIKNIDIRINLMRILMKDNVDIPCKFIFMLALVGSL